MGLQQSKDLNKYQLSFLVSKDSKYSNSIAYKVNMALNIYYIYFHIDSYSLNYLINSDIELYITNICSSNSRYINEDVLKTTVKNETKINVINKKTYYDMEYITNKSNKIIFRSPNLMTKSFDIIYIMTNIL